MKPQAGFWYVSATVDGKDVSLAVSAFTERSAKVQARKCLGPGSLLYRIGPVQYAHAWVIDFQWKVHRKTV